MIRRCETFGDTLAFFPVGTRVHFVALDDRYPHFVVPVGTTGTVTEATRDGILIHVDQDIEGLTDSEEWAGDYQWFPGDDYDRPFEVLP